MHGRDIRYRLERDDDGLYPLGGESIMNMHAAIWMDHQGARIFHFHPDKLDESTAHLAQHDIHKHPEGPEGWKERPEDAKRFFHEVTQSLDGTDAIFIVGPSTAMLEFFKYVHTHDQALETKIVGIETLEHPTAGQVVAYAKKHFKLGDSARSR